MPAGIEHGGSAAVPHGRRRPLIRIGSPLPACATVCLMAGELSIRSEEIAAVLAAGGPLSLEELAALADVPPRVLGRYLEEHPQLVMAPDGKWVTGLRLADGVAFTHELSAVEVASGILSVDDDLALWGQFAIGGLPLADGGEVRATTVLDLPSGAGNDLPAGQGMIGQALTGPDGWLAGFSAGDLLSVRLREGALEITARGESEQAPGSERLRDICAFAAVEALKRYVEGTADEPCAPLHEIIIGRLFEEPKIFSSPLPPLSGTLRAAGLETFGGSVGVRGTAWNMARIRSLDRAEAVAGTMALSLLLTWIDEDPGHGPALLRDYLTVSPAVVGYVADEVERRAAEGTRFGDQLSALRRIATSGPERAAVSLLAARAAEGAGDSGTAERLVHEALTAQPDLPAALADAGEYAACRGDVRAADGYLRRCSYPTAKALREALRRQLTPPKSTSGRNQPCPCGSGRKYKLCCLSSAVHPLTDRAEALYALLATYAERATGAEILGRLITESGGNPQSTLLCVDLLLTDCGFTDRFLQDRLFSASARRLDLFCGRILHDGTRPRLFTLPVRVPREERHELSTLLTSRPSAEQLAAFFAPRPEPHLLNADGQDYYDTEVVWEVPGEQQAWPRLADRLVQIDDDIAELHAESAGETTSRGRVTRENGRWRLWANSRERLTEFEEILRPFAPGAREVHRKAERMGGGPHPRARVLTVESYLIPAEEEQSTSRRQAESWMDTVIGDLGMTPREAALAGGTARAELEMLLDDLDWNNDRAAEQGRPALMDVELIRRELGWRQADRRLRLPRPRAAQRAGPTQKHRLGVSRASGPPG